MQTDWADELVAKKAARKNFQVTAEELRTKLNHLVKFNVERNDITVEDETKRLIEIFKNEDAGEELIYNYSKMGIFTTASHHEPGKIHSVELNFDDAQWVDLLNREGELLPVCCADTSRIREILQEVCCDNHYIKVSDLQELVTLVRHHEFADDHPLNYVLDLYEKIKNDVEKTRNHIKEIDLTNPENALEALLEYGSLFSWNDFVSEKFTKHAHNEHSLAIIALCIKTLSEKLKTLSMGDVEAYGIFIGDKIAMMKSGIAVFQDQGHAQEVCAKWNEEKSIYAVSRCRITMEKGIEKCQVTPFQS